MRVVHVITGLDTGGAELMLLRLLQQIDRARVEPSVVSLSTIGPTGRLIEDMGIPVQALRMRPNRPDPRALFALVRLLRHQAPDIVQTWLYHANLVGGLAAKLAGGMPVIWGLHQANLDPAFNKRSTMIAIRAGARASRWLPSTVVCCAHAAEAAHVAIGYRPEPMLVIPNGFDLDRFRPSGGARQAIREELGLASNATLIGLISRFDPQKDHRTFVRAAGLLARRHGDVHFVMCGNGITWRNARLVSWIDEAGIRERCHLLGRRDDMEAIQASLDIATSSSAGEALPLAIGEAMASGVPCVVTNVGDSADLVGPTGRVVPPEDPAALSIELLDLIELGSGQRLALGAAARERIASRFSLASAGSRYEHLYRRLDAHETVRTRPGAVT